jgi:metallophosphoesterase (TIGR00282 family)
MRLLFLGDVVGRTGRDAVEEHLPSLKERLAIDFAVVNGENAAAGFGLTEKIVEGFYAAGADVISTGNHVWDQKEALTFIERHPRVLRPANFPSGTPGAGSGLFEAANGAQVVVVNGMGRLFMNPLEDPFATLERELSSCPLGEAADAIIIDFHAEATSEKMAAGHFADGRASLVVGTHTHIPTADVHVMRNGTAYQTDAGMCGDYDSVIGMDKEEAVNRFLRRYNGSRLTPATGLGTVCGIVVETGADGLAERAEPVRVGGQLPDFIPAWD